MKTIKKNNNRVTVSRRAIDGVVNQANDMRDEAIHWNKIAVGMSKTAQAWRSRTIVATVVAVVWFIVAVVAVIL